MKKLIKILENRGYEKTTDEYGTECYDRNLTNVSIGFRFGVFQPRRIQNLNPKAVWIVSGIDGDMFNSGVSSKAFYKVPYLLNNALYNISFESQLRNPEPYDREVQSLLDEVASIYMEYRGM